MAGKASVYYPNGVKPSLGESIVGTRIGRESRGIFTWCACPGCGLERWVARSQVGKLCMHCAAVSRQIVGERNPRWNGGIRHAGGYNYISVPETHPFIEMASRVFVHGRHRYNIAEHRLMMAQYLGRPLQFYELVHHVNGVKDDNRIENLELLSHHKDHLPSMNLQRIVAELQNRITTLEFEVVRLQSLLDKGRYGNPELADLQIVNRASAETLHGASLVDEEKVHPYRKL